MDTSTVDNLRPGSKEAEAIGCTCPVIDNHYGDGRYGNGELYGWFMVGNCPIHGGTKS